MPSNAGAIDLITLSRFTPFSSLNSELVELLATDIDLCNAPVGYQLFDIDESSSEQYFLTSGKVQLTTQDLQTSCLEAGMPNSNHPMSRTIPRKHRVVALTDISYFSINAAVLNELDRSVKKPTDYLSLLAKNSTLDERGNTLFHLFQHELMRGRFELPSIPDIALKIRQLIDTPECNVAQLATLVSSDPAIAIKIIQTANSALYRGVSKCDDITSAITRLGLITTKQLVTSFAILNLFESDSTTLKTHMERLRRESVAVAVYSQGLARALNDFNTEEALLAGLLHTIGALAVLYYADRYTEIENNELLLALLVHNLSSRVGTLIMQEWNFSDELTIVTKESGNWLRNNSNSRDYCDLIILAKLCVLAQHDATSVLSQHSAIPVIKQLQRELSTQQIGHVVEQAEQHIDELQRLLS